MHKGPMRWYNPKLEDFEWREVPASDEEALTLLESYRRGLPGVARLGGEHHDGAHPGRRSGKGAGEG